MFGNNALIFYYNRLNTFSFNTLAGAIDSAPDLADLPIHLALKEEQLHKLTADFLKHHKHIVLTLSILTCQFEGMKQLIRQPRTSCGSCITILAGGPHVTACAEEVLRAGADIAVRGEGETVFPGILRNIAQGLQCDSLQTPLHPSDLDTFFSFRQKEGCSAPLRLRAAAYFPVTSAKHRKSLACD